ncbi:MAG: NADH:quinone oxidoreductase subunit M [Candidatus Westeberhardia cardiocondylae]|nr:NADH:quinone oxidoreductase subunit M [Candidatus Westeberhardia cardiocondylae]
MLLPYLVLIPFIGGLISWKIDNITNNKKITKFVSLITMGITLSLSIILWTQEEKENISNTFPHWKSEYTLEWISRFGINIHFAIDNLSNTMIILSTFMGIIAILCSSGSEIKNHLGAFHFNILWAITNVIGIFLSVDMILFYIFWEITLFPIYFLIILWGLPTSTLYERISSAKKFLVYSQTSGIIMLTSILVLASVYHWNYGIWTFSYENLLNTKIPKILEPAIMLGFFLAFSLKIPIIPFHAWLPNAHKQAPTAGSIELTGLLLKTGIYGIFRFNLPLFPHSSYNFSTIATYIGIIGIFYGAWMAYTQNNIKKVIAYSNISHMGYAIIAAYSQNKLAYQGTILHIIAHTISSAGIFIIFGQIYKRVQTYNIKKIDGMWNKLQTIPSMLLFFFAATLGIPGTGNFIGETTILFGIYAETPILATIASMGLIITTVYTLKIMQKILYQDKKFHKKIQHVTKQEQCIVYLIAILLILTGIFPQFIIQKSNNTMNNIHEYFTTHKNQF